MLQITNGVVTLRVTRGAFNNFYSRHGFSSVEDESAAKGSGVGNFYPLPENQPLEDSLQEKTDFDDLEEDEDLTEIPLEEMTGTQLRQYASDLGLEFEGLRKRELRQLIQDHLG